MRLICFWCFLLAAAIRAQDTGFYAPQTFRQQNADSYSKGLFTPIRNDVAPQGSNQEAWRPKPVHESWGGPPAPYVPPAPAYRPDPWRPPVLTKEQQASILHHKQALTKEGSFQFEYASDNGLAAGEIIEPDGSRVGSYQYKDPTGQLVKLKYRAGKEGFQILEGSHIPKSPEPVPPANQDSHYVTAYQQQREAYQLQQQYNQQQPQPMWTNQNQNGGSAGGGAGGQHYAQGNWRPSNAQEDDGQYRENDIESKEPHTFGEGYSFAFQG